MDYVGNKHIVLYFYPKDDTPGCTIEANDFTRLASQFAELDTVVIGVSKDNCESHAAFIKNIIWRSSYWPILTVKYVKLWCMA